VEADGTTRTVHYTADAHNGFNAHVMKSGHAIHPPVYGHQAALHGAHSAPVVHYAAPQAQDQSPLAYHP
jgi:hypothetical protein